MFPLSMFDFELLILGLLAKEFGRVIETALYVSRGVFSQNCFGEKIFFHRFLIFGKRITDFWRKILGMVVKPSFYASKKKFWGDKNWRKKLNQISFELWERNFQKFAQKIPAEPSKQHSTYHEEKFQEYLFWKFLFLPFFPNSGKNFRTLSEEL